MNQDDRSVSSKSEKIQIKAINHVSVTKIKNRITGFKQWHFEKEKRKQQLFRITNA